MSVKIDPPGWSWGGADSPPGNEGGVEGGIDGIEARTPTNALVSDKMPRGPSIPEEEAFPRWHNGIKESPTSHEKETIVAGGMVRPNSRFVPIGAESPQGMQQATRVVNNGCQASPHSSFWLSNWMGETGCPI